MTTDHTQTHESRVRQMAHGLCVRHFRVLPVRPWEKIPALNNWPTAATDDPSVLARLLAEDAGFNIGLACGPQPNGLNLVVIDIDPAHGGFETWSVLLSKHADMPDTAWHGTPSGGRHYFFDAPVPIRNSRRLGQGVDVRGEGGQVVLPPSRRRDANGEIVSYTALRGYGIWKHPVAPMPRWLVDLCLPAVKPMPAVTVPQWVIDQVPDLRHDEMSPATWVREHCEWPTVLAQNGWTQLSGDRWRRPDKTDEGHSAVLHDGGPLVVWSTELPPALERLGKPTADNSLAFSLFDFIAGYEFGGDRTAFAAHVRSNLMLRNGAPVPSAAGAKEETPKRQLVVKGDVFLYDLAIDVPARWGQGQEIFWASGESLILCGVIGSGKTTLAGQLVAGMCGLDAKLLGQPITEARRVLVLAMDRPRQIARALVRHFPEADHRALVHDRLVVHQGPLAKLITTDDEQIVRLAQEYDCDVVVVDSLKDLGGSLSDEATGAAINRSFQLCLAKGVDVLALHHTRKESNSEGAKKENTLASVYGSNWITAGAGSVLMLYGEPGALDQKLMHLKSPINPLGPFDVVHDNHAGTTEIAKGWDCYAWLVRRGSMGGTIGEATQSEHGRPITTDSVRKKTERKLEALVVDGRARKEGRASPGVAVRYFACDADR